MSASAPSFEQRFAQALQLAETNRLADARAALASLTREAPAHVPARRLFAAVLQQLGDGGAALGELENASALQPLDAGLQRQRADLLLGIGRPADAVDAARAACALAPHADGNNLTLGLALLADARADEAIAVLAAALTTSVHSLALRRTLVRALLLARRSTDARECALDAGLVDDRETLAGVIADFAATGAWRESIALLELRTLRHGGDAQAWIALAAARHRAGLASASIDACDRAIALQPNAQTPREIRATALIDRGDVETGLADYRGLLVAGDAATAARHLVLMHYDPAQDNAPRKRPTVTPYGALAHYLVRVDRQTRGPRQVLRTDDADQFRLREPHTRAAGLLHDPRHDRVDVRKIRQCNR